MTSSTTTQIPGYVVGTWDIDPTHSEVGFSVRRISDVQIVLGKPGWRGMVTAADAHAETALHGEKVG